MNKLDIYKSKIEQKMRCRKCKTTFLSVDGSACPYCVKPPKPEQTDEPKRKRKTKDEPDEPPEDDEKSEDDE